jgi:hypothetical protein
MDARLEIKLLRLETPVIGRGEYFDLVGWIWAKNIDGKVSDVSFYFF